MQALQEEVVQLLLQFEFDLSFVPGKTIGAQLLDNLALLPGFDQFERAAE